jgi:hypothetical protein
MIRRRLSLAAVLLAAFAFSACATPTAPKQPNQGCGQYAGSSDC